VIRVTERIEVDYVWSSGIAIIYKDNLHITLNSTELKLILAHIEKEKNERKI